MEEAVALRTGMMMAREAQWKEEEFQSDCKAIADMIMEENVMESRTAVILDDIDNMRGLFDQCTFSFVNRIGNIYAQNLAKFAVRFVKNLK